MREAVRFDAPFWSVLLASIIFVGFVGCLGVAAAAQDAAKDENTVVTVDDS